MMKTSPDHQPRPCGTSRKVMDILRERGIEPKMIEYLKSPLSDGEIMALVNEMGVPLRDMVRAKEPIYAERGSPKRPPRMMTPCCTRWRRSRCS